MRARRLLMAVAVVAVMTSHADGEPILRFKTPSTVTTDGGSVRRLPPGYFLNEEQWRERDERMKKAENDATRFKTQNESLRKSMRDVAWKETAVIFAGGLMVGAVLLQMAK